MQVCNLLLVCLLVSGVHVCLHLCGSSVTVRLLFQSVVHMYGHLCTIARLLLLQSA